MPRPAVSIGGAAVAEAAAQRGAVVLVGALRNASAVAAAVLAEQQRRGARTSVAIIAAGEQTGRDAAPRVRFAVEDQLGAGAIVDALAARGIDHTSPEAAVACESFRALRRATTHLLTASGSGLELIERGRRDEVVAAAAVDAASVVPVLRDGAFTRSGPSARACRYRGVIAASRAAGLISRRDHVKTKRSSNRGAHFAHEVGRVTRRCRYARCPAGHTPIQGASSVAVSP